MPIVLMTTYVHLVVDPRRNSARVRVRLKRVAGRQTWSVNARENRSGPLWEARCKSRAMQRDVYLLACSQHVALHPLRAGVL